MHNHRITSFVTFTTLFFVVEAIFALAAWTSLSMMYSSSLTRSADQEESSQIKKRKIGAELTSRGIKREDEYDDETDSNSDRRLAVRRANERKMIKKEEDDDDYEGYDEDRQSQRHAFPAFPQRRRKYSSASSASTSRSWPRSRSLSVAAGTMPVRVKKEERDEVRNEDAGVEGDQSSTAATASSSGYDHDSGVWSLRVERGLEARRRQEEARRRSRS